MIAGALVIAGMVSCAVYFIAVSRRCDELRDVRRGSLDYRLCGEGNELIARVPILGQRPQHRRLLTPHARP
jgi:hypothetical protein